MRALSLLCVVAVLAGVARTASAEPILQLYVEGATYDSVTESWVFEADSSGQQPFRLWAIGNLKPNGPISDVRLAVAYDATLGDQTSVVLDFTPSTTGGLGNFGDPSTPGDPVFLQFEDDGSTPKLTDGRDLPSHGEYGDGVAWQEYGLGDFTLTDSPIGDFIDEFPTLDPDAKLQGQINVYEIRVQKPVSEPVRLHFDLYDSVQAGNKARGVFSPFSHDGDATGTVVPEPSSMALLGCGLCGLGLVTRRRRRESSTSG